MTIKYEAYESNVAFHKMLIQHKGIRGIINNDYKFGEYDFVNCYDDHVNMYNDLFTYAQILQNIQKIITVLCLRSDCIDSIFETTKNMDMAHMFNLLSDLKEILADQVEEREGCDIYDGSSDTVEYQAFTVAEQANWTGSTFVNLINMIDAAKKGLTNELWLRDWNKTEDEILQLAKGNGLDVHARHFLWERSVTFDFVDTDKDYIFRQYRLWNVSEDNNPCFSISDLELIRRLKAMGDNNDVTVTPAKK